jgi:hypothetical protein
MKLISIITFTWACSLFANQVAQESTCPNVILINVDNHHEK